MGENNEAVYDNEIAPLMTRIIEICKAHHIPVTATFEYAPGDFCSTFIPFGGESPCHQQARDAICPPARSITITTKNADGSPTVIDHIIVVP